MLESTAGDAPHVVSNVLINWPLHIVGGGASAADTVIEVHLLKCLSSDFRRVVAVHVRANSAVRMLLVLTCDVVL
jgi:hypothetical protein